LCWSSKTKNAFSSPRTTPDLRISLSSLGPHGFADCRYGSFCDLGCGVAAPVGQASGGDDAGVVLLVGGREIFGAELAGAGAFEFAAFVGDEREQLFLLGGAGLE
jgi:hypothetical protein